MSINGKKKFDPFGKLRTSTASSVEPVNPELSRRIEKLVREAVRALSAKMNTTLDNVAFVIEDEPRQKRAGETNIRKDEALLGLYEGIPKTERGFGYFGALPDKITIFQKPLEKLAGRDKVKLKRLIYEVVWHEVGHHLGFDEKEIRALEARQKQKIAKARI
jgi:predicted Zn-dependent protease with MMP-like domain